MQVVRQFAPDRKAILQALQRLLREPAEDGRESNVPHVGLVPARMAEPARDVR